MELKYWPLNFMTIWISKFVSNYSIWEIVLNNIIIVILWRMRLSQKDDVRSMLLVSKLSKFLIYKNVENFLFVRSDFSNGWHNNYKKHCKLIILGDRRRRWHQIVRSNYSCNRNARDMGDLASQRVGMKETVQESI